MNHDNETGEGVFRKLKSEVMAGLVSVHTRLDIAGIADSYGVSTTPVREAAMRLLGEGLVEVHAKGGLRPSFPSEHRLRELLDLNGKLAALSLAWNAGERDIDPDWASSASNEMRARLVFRGIARRSGNRVFVDTVERISDKLAPFRHYEDSVLSQVTEELAALHALLGFPADLRRALRSYHRRRRIHAAQLTWALTMASASTLK